MKTVFQEKIDQARAIGELSAVAENAGTSERYLTGHLYRGTREPKVLLANELAIALGLPLKKIVNHFEEVGST